jgi:hypothetical protein
MVYGGEHATLERASARERQLKRWSREMPLDPDHRHGRMHQSALGDFTLLILIACRS